MMTNKFTSQGLYEPSTEHDACGVGFVVDIKGRKSHKIIENSLTILKNLMHRGACGCEENTGDGVGMLTQLPHKFFSRVCSEIGITLPDDGHYGAGMVFLPTEPAQQQACIDRFQQVVEEEGQHVLGWRDVPTDDALLGLTAKSGEPVFKQIFIGRSTDIEDEAAFERKLYVIRKRVEHMVYDSDLSQRDSFYIPSLSYRTCVYKGC